MSDTLRAALDDAPHGNVIDLLRDVANYLWAKGGGPMEDRCRSAADAIEAALAESAPTPEAMDPSIDCIACLGTGFALDPPEEAGTDVGTTGGLVFEAPRRVHLPQVQATGGVPDVCVIGLGPSRLVPPLRLAAALIHETAPALAHYLRVIAESLQGVNAPVAPTPAPQTCATCQHCEPGIGSARLCMHDDTPFGVMTSRHAETWGCIWHAPRSTDGGPQ
jgi:hypothetical protein